MVKLPLAKTVLKAKEKYLGVCPVFNLSVLKSNTFKYLQIFLRAGLGSFISVLSFTFLTLYFHVFYKTAI